MLLIALVLSLLQNPDAWMALLSLTCLEIILGIDNVVFIAILAGKLPPQKQRIAYQLGLTGALITRVALLFSISWVIGLKADLFEWMGYGVSGRDLILCIGGLFLIGKSVQEIYEKVELQPHQRRARPHAVRHSLWSIVLQITVLDIVFSLDSIITAVGMIENSDTAEGLAIMVAAIVTAVLVMMAFARPVGDFVNRHPSVKILALSFLILIGVLLLMEAFDGHVDKGYVYFAMGFALTLELVNIRRQRNLVARDNRVRDTGTAEDTGTMIPVRPPSVAHQEE
ncbi:MAG: TerC family protein [Myxococcota bacterium]